MIKRGYSSKRVAIHRSTEKVKTNNLVTRSKILQNYLDELLSSYYYIDFRGIAQLERFISLELDEVFVPLMAIPLAPEQAGEVDLLRYILAGTEKLKPDLERWLQIELTWSKYFLRDLKYNDILFPAVDAAVGGGRQRGEARLKKSRLSLQSEVYRHLSAAILGAKEDLNPTIVYALLKKIEMAKAGASGGEAQDFGNILANCRQFVLLGDPGSGKTTLLKWLARTYALGTQAVLQRLRVHEDLVPIVFSVARYARDCASANSPLAISDYVEQTWNQRSNGLGSVLRKLLDSGQTLLLFDGLDEVPDMQARWTASRYIESCLRACAEKGSNGSRCIVTSRKYGYELCRLHDCKHWELAAFGQEQINKFIHGWCRALEKSLHPNAPRIAGADEEARELAAAINDPGSAHHDSLQGFVQNPLLLTIVALVRWQYRILPERRARLYELALTTLIETWNRMRSLGGRIEGIELDARETMELWEPVALWMHRQYPSGTAPRSDILVQLAGKLAQDGIARDAAIQTAESYLDAAARWAGLLVERGPNVFGFVHQTFQEYLSARALVRSAQDPHEQLKRNFFDPRWHEIILLAAGYLGEVQGRSEDCTALVEHIRNTSDTLEPILHRYLLLAADIVADRAPVSLRCHEETLLRLIEECPSANGSNFETSFQNAIASLCWLEPGNRVLTKAMGMLLQEKVLNWRSRAALMLLGSRTPTKAIDLLRLGLKDADIDVRGLSAALMLRTESASLKVLIPFLRPQWIKTGAWALDRRAEQCLAEALARPEVAQHFVELLKDADPGAYFRAAETLKAVRPLSEAAQAGLVELLKDKEPEVRVRAARTLQAVRPLSEAEQVGLVELLKAKEPEVRVRAAKALQAVRPLSEAAQAGLVELLNDKQPEARLRAAEALQVARPLSEAEQAGLVELLRAKEPEVRVRAAEALQAVRPLSEAEQAGLVELLKDKESGVRVRAAKALRAARPLSEAEQAGLVELLKDADPMVRFRAAGELQAVRPLSEAEQAGLVELLKDKQPVVRIIAAEELQAVRPLSEAAQAGLVELLKDKEPGVRVRAARTLQAVRPLSEAAQAGLVELLKDKQPEVRFRAAEALQAARPLSEAAQAGLVELLKDKQPMVRVRAAEALQAVRPMSEAVQAGLVELLKAKEPEVHIRAARTLQAVRPLSEAEQAGLVELLKAKERMVRVRAAEALAHALAELLKQGSEPPAWLATHKPASAAPPAAQLIQPADSKPATLRELLDSALNGSDSQREAACQNLARQIVSGSETYPKTVAMLLTELQNQQFGDVLGLAGLAETQLRNLLADALSARLRDLAGRRRISGVSSILTDTTFLRSLPGALLPQVVDATLEDLGDELRQVALSRLVEVDFDHLAPELQRMVLGLYNRLRKLAGAAELRRILRRISRAYDADETETRAQACRSLAVFLPDLGAKERLRCFAQLIESATGDDEEMKDATIESLRMIYGHLSRLEREALRKIGFPR